MKGNASVVSAKDQKNQSKKNTYRQVSTEFTLHGNRIYFILLIHCFIEIRLSSVC
jgi:hypothetical protein